MSGTSHTPPTFVDGNKFDGTIKDPSTIIKFTSDDISGESPKSNTTKLKPTVIKTIPWDFNDLTASEWKVRNVWVKGLLLYNIKNAVGLEVNISGLAAELWRSLMAITK